MCFGGGGGGTDSGEQIRRQEEERQERVRANTGRISSDFSKFDKPYFDTIAQSVRDYYFPQVDEQYRDADRATTFRFADNAASSAAARTKGELVRDYGRARQSTELDAQQAAENAKRDVESERSRLVGMAEAGTSQESIAAQSRLATDQQIGRPSFNPVTDFFRRYTANLGNAQIMRGEGYQPSGFWTRPVDYLRNAGRGAVTYSGELTMCYIELAALAAQAAAGYGKYKSARAVEKKQDDNMAAEMERQRVLQAEADARLGRESQRFNRPAQEDERSQIVQAVQGGLEKAAPPAAVLEPGVPASTPQAATTEIARSVQDALRQGVEESKRLANLTSFGRLTGNNEMALGRAGEDLAQIAGFSQRSNAIVPYEQQSAVRTKGRRHALFGEVAGAVGQALALASMAKGAGAAGGGAEAAAAGANKAMQTQFPLSSGIGLDPNRLIGTPIAELVRRGRPIVAGGY